LAFGGESPQRLIGRSSRMLPGLQSNHATFRWWRYARPRAISSAIVLPCLQMSNNFSYAVISHAMQRVMVLRKYAPHLKGCIYHPCHCMVSKRQSN
jgi:hypothetical protein